MKKPWRFVKRNKMDDRMDLKNEKKVIAILPMRGGSERIKNKNISLVNHRPLYEYAIRTLLKCNFIDKIVINTDIEEILDRYQTDDRFIILRRKEDLRGNSNINGVIHDTLERINGRVDGEYFIQLHATNPLLTSETIDNSIIHFFENQEKGDSLFSVTKQQKRLWDENGPLNHKLNDSPTTQDLKYHFEENSCFYIFNRESFFKNKNRIGEKPIMFETPLLESFDIDTLDELNIIEKLLRFE